MKNFIRNNRLYFALLGLFIIVGGIQILTTGRGDALFFFSGHRTPALNLFFTYGTKLGEEPMYFLFGIAFLFSRIRQTLLIVLTGLTVMGVSFGLKTFFAIDRPIVFLQANNLLEKIILIDGVDVHSGATSFPSGHSMSAFALYSMLIFLLPNKTRYVLPLFLMAFLVALSRVYLVQHFWIDIYAGGLIGALLAMGLYAFDHRVQDKLNRPLFSLKKFW